MQIRYIVLCLGLSLVGIADIPIPNNSSNTAFAHTTVTDNDHTYTPRSDRFNFYDAASLDINSTSWYEIDFTKYDGSTKFNTVDNPSAFYEMDFINTSDQSNFKTVDNPSAFYELDFINTNDQSKFKTVDTIVQAKTLSKSQSKTNVKADFRSIEGLRQHLPLTIATTSTLTAQDRKNIECIAWNLYFEVRGGAYREQVAVAYVPINRLGKADFSDDICTNIFQIDVHNGQLKHQFSWAGIHIGPNWKREDVAWEKMQYIAMAVYKKQIHDEGNGATYFHSTSIVKSWAPSAKKIVLGGHLFWQG